MLTANNLELTPLNSPSKSNATQAFTSTNINFQTHKEIDLRPVINFAPSSILYINNHQILCIGGYDGTLTIWNSDTMELIARYPKFSHDPILEIKYYHRKNLLIVFSSTIRIAKISPNKLIKSIKTLNSNYFNNQFLGISEEEGLLITKTSDYRFNIYSLNGFAPLRKFAPENVREAFQTKSLSLCIPTKRMLLVFCNNKLEGYNILSGKRLWIKNLQKPLESDIISINYCKEENTVVGITEDGEVLLWRLEENGAGVINSSSFKLNHIGTLRQSIGVTNGGQILTRDINKVYCLNIKQKDIIVANYKENWPESVLFTDFDKEKVFALSWTTRKVQVISVRETGRENSPRRALKRIDSWLKTMWSMVVPFVTL